MLSIFKNFELCFPRSINIFFYSPWVVRNVNMMFKDLANALPWMETACKAGKAVVTFVLNLVVMFVLNYQHGLAIAPEGFGGGCGQ